MNAAVRGGGASIQATLSTTWLSRSLVLEARRLDAHLQGKLGSTLSPFTKKPISRRPCCSLPRSGTAVPSHESELVRSSSFNKKNNEVVSDWNHASKYWRFATFARLFSSPRASSRCLPSFALRRRLLGLRRQSFRAPDCRSGVDLNDLGAKKDYEHLLAKKWRLGTDEDALVLRLNVQANFPEQRRVQAGPLTGYIAMRSLPDGSISCLLRMRATANPFTRASCYSWSSKGNTSTTVWQKIRSVPHFLQPPAIDKEPESNAKMYVNQTRDEMALTWQHILRHEQFRAKYRYVGVFSNAVFNHFLLEDLSQTNRNRLVGAPRAHFRPKLKIDK